MSAFFVGTEHVDYLLTFMHGQRFASVYIPSEGRRLDTGHTIIDEETGRCASDKIGAILLAENIRSLAHRYPDSHTQLHDNYEPESYRFREHSRANVDGTGKVAVQVLKACNCFDYQACESPDYEQTDAARIIHAIRACAIGALPGYEAAEWGVPERPAPLANGTPSGPISLMSVMAGRA